MVPSEAVTTTAVKPITTEAAVIYEELVRERGSDPITGAPARPDGEQPDNGESRSDGGS